MTRPRLARVLRQAAVACGLLALVVGATTLIVGWWLDVIRSHNSNPRAHRKRWAGGSDRGPRDTVATARPVTSCEFAGLSLSATYSTSHRSTPAGVNTTSSGNSNTSPDKPLCSGLPPDRVTCTRGCAGCLRHARTPTMMWAGRHAIVVNGAGEGSESAQSIPKPPAPAAIEVAAVPRGRTLPASMTGAPRYSSLVSLSGHVHS